MQKHRFMRSFTFKIAVISFLLQSALVTSTKAGGLYLNEFGTPSMGTAGAGAQAWADDASTALHNPAGMTRIQGDQFMLTSGLFFSRVKFDASPGTFFSGGNGGDAGGWAPLGGLFYVHSLSDRLKFGFNTMSVSGSVLDYDNQWAGRFLVQDVSLLTVTMNPSLAYKFTDKLSASVGFMAMYGMLEMDLAIPAFLIPPGGQATLDGDDWGFGYNLGLLYELSDRTRLGVIYLSEIELEFDGDLEVTPGGLSVGSKTKLPLAQGVRGSIYHELNDKWAVLGTIGWEDWSTFDSLLISTENGSASVSRNWRDTYHYAGGVHYRPHEKWLFQAGIAYDTSPVSSDDRTPDLPVDRQVRYAIGAQYKWSETCTIGTAFEYMDLGKAKINRPLFKGEYEDNEAYVIGFYIRWKL